MFNDTQFKVAKTTPFGYLNKAGITFGKYTMSWILFIAFILSFGGFLLELVLINPYASSPDLVVYNANPNKEAEQNPSANNKTGSKKSPKSSNVSTSDINQDSGSQPIPVPAGLNKHVAVYLPYWDMDSALASVQANPDKISVINPFWYAPVGDGSISSFSSAGSGSVISFAHSNNIKIIPSINNSCSPAPVEQIISDQNIINTHIQNVVNLIDQYGYDGINIDYECLSSGDYKDNFSVLISDLSTAVHARGKSLTIALHAKTSDAGGWSGTAAQDWSVLGTKADLVLAMTYDYHWETSTAGDIAPVSWMNSVISYGKSRISAAKILVGIHFYGYDWVGSSAEDKTYNDVLGLISTYSPSVAWSPEQEKYFTYNNGSDHTVYFADHETVAPRLNIANSQGVAGVGIWRAGQEDPLNWSAIASAFK